MHMHETACLKTLQNALPQVGPSSGPSLGFVRSIRSAMSITPRLGILAAMPPEIEKLKQHVENQEDHKHGSAFTFTTGTLGGRPVVFAAANVSCQAH
jgi:hypothetical protein